MTPEPKAKHTARIKLAGYNYINQQIFFQVMDDTSVPDAATQVLHCVNLMPEAIEALAEVKRVLEAGDCTVSMPHTYKRVCAILAKAQNPE